MYGRAARVACFGNRRVFFTPCCAELPLDGCPYTPDEQATFIRILTQILDSPDAIDGLLETMGGGE